MKFVTTWKVRPGKLQEAVDRFIGTGDPRPAGIKSLGRWHRTDMSGGFHLIEADDAAAVAEYSAMWADLLEIESAMVVEDAEAINAYVKIHGVTAKAAGAAG
jgi:hypothetical protein